MEPGVITTYAALTEAARHIENEYYIIDIALHLRAVWLTLITIDVERMVRVPPLYLETGVIQRVQGRELNGG